MVWCGDACCGVVLLRFVCVCVVFVVVFALCSVCSVMCCIVWCCVVLRCVVVWCVWLRLRCVGVCVGVFRLF